MTAMAYVWLAAAVILAIVEGATVNMVSVWFAGGAIVAFFVAIFGGNIYWQLALFILASGALLASLRPLALRRTKVKKVRTNADRVIGMTGIVTEEINNLQGVGAVKAGGMEWTARSNADQIIPAGTQVTVLSINGVKLYVSPAELPAEVR